MEKGPPDIADRPEFIWHWPVDAGRIAPVPGGVRLTLLAAEKFHARLAGDVRGTVSRFSARHGREAVRLTVPEVETLTEVTLQVVLDSGDCEAVVLVLPGYDKVPVSPVAGPLPGAHGICGNHAGASVQARAAWGTIESKYDALLAANLNASGPDDRRVLFTRARQWLRHGGETHEVSAGAVREFVVLSPSELEWRFAAMGAQWSIRLTLGEGNAVSLRWHSWRAPAGDWEFAVRPDLENRSFHGITQAFRGPEHGFREALHLRGPGAVSFALGDGWQLNLESSAAFTHQPEWNYMVPLALETGRGLEPATDLFSPGIFRWTPDRAHVLEIVASVGVAWASRPSPALIHPHARQARVMGLAESMRAALDLFLAQRDGGLTVIAGFPWFLDWGRDSLIFARGLAAAGRFQEALAVVQRFAAFESGGSIPNLIRGSDASNRETSDAPLWLLLALREICVHQPSALREKSGGRTLAEVAGAIVKAHVSGTAHGVRLDEASGLLWSPAHYTWMDTDRPAGSPREGYPIEIQSLWVAGLEFSHTLDASCGWAALAEKARDSVAHLYWRETEGFMADCLHAASGVSAMQAAADDHLRPNQLFTITLGLVSDADKCRRILTACQCLLIPGALRSLAPRRVQHPLPVEWNGTALNDPHAPYHGKYTGPEETRRKPSYHNGTAWTWLYPLFCEALAAVYPGARDQARSLMSASAWLMRRGCPGQLAEIVDGDAPHALRGCGAQAWSVSEWVRVQVALEHPPGAGNRTVGEFPAAI